jgi:hypothetical protein
MLARKIEKNVSIICDPTQNSDYPFPKVPIQSDVDN